MRTSRAKLTSRVGEKSKNANRVDSFIWHLRVTGDLKIVLHLFFRLCLSYILTEKREAFAPLSFMSFYDSHKLSSLFHT